MDGICAQYAISAGVPVDEAAKGFCGICMMDSKYLYYTCTMYDGLDDIKIKNSRACILSRQDSHCVRLHRTVEKYSVQCYSSIYHVYYEDSTVQYFLWRDGPCGDDNARKVRQRMTCIVRSTRGIRHCCTFPPWSCCIQYTVYSTRCLLYY